MPVHHILRTLVALSAVAAWASSGVELTARSVGAAAAQASPRTETRHVVVTTSASAPAAAPGARVTLYVDVAPKAKMHVYAPAQDGFIPVSLAVTPSPSFRASPPRFPKPEKLLFEALNETQLVYSHSFRIEQPIVVAAGPAAGSGPLTIAGTLRYQACDDRICYKPENVPVSWTVALKRP